jgi:DNA invertase Pin-like site-specific DNA recombinase|tara:strand:+ start:1491 stop:1649 length:159 start_codon:yes stop_codon:yes gene_type:complete
MASNVADLIELIKHMSSQDVIVRLHKEGQTSTGKQNAMQDLMLDVLCFFVAV